MQFIQHDLRHVQSEPCALAARIHLEEQLKDIVYVTRLYSRSIILDLNHHCVIERLHSNIYPMFVNFWSVVFVRIKNDMV